MRIAFIGCVHFSASMLSMLLEHSEAELVGLVTRDESPFNADYHDLRLLTKHTSCPVFLDDSKNQTELAAWLRDRQPDVIYCLGWSYLLSAEVLTVPPLGVVGYHPAALPQNRGRHPIIWALALGLEQTASTFFLMDENADSGDILSQVPVSIAPHDDAGDLYQKLSDTAVRQLQELTTALAEGKAKRTPQDHSRANYWRKRSALDGCIDWRMPAAGIRNLIRSLARPYPGAHCNHEGKAVKIWHAIIHDTAPTNLEPGKVIKVRQRNILVKCGDGAVELIEHDFDPIPSEGSYL